MKSVALIVGIIFGGFTYFALKHTQLQEKKDKKLFKKLTKIKKEKKIGK
jgi:preprotein translocase subunit YajC